jgi:hypothetical protein
MPNNSKVHVPGRLSLPPGGAGLRERLSSLNVTEFMAALSQMRLSLR